MAKFSITCQLAVLMCLIGWEGISPLEPELGVADHFYTIAGAPHLLLALVAIWARSNKLCGFRRLAVCVCDCRLSSLDGTGRAEN